MVVLALYLGGVAVSLALIDEPFPARLGYAANGRKRRSDRSLGMILNLSHTQK